MVNTLTSFRFLAAFMVFLLHAGIWSKYQLGYLGVSFFFILSGFIITLNYKEKFTRFNPEQMKNFYIARFAKIYPVHFLTFFFAIPYYFLIPLKHESILYVFQAMTNLLLIQSFIPFGNVSFNGVSWSLSDELFFYAVFPLIIFVFSKFTVSLFKKLSFIAAGWLLMTILFSIIPSGHYYMIWLTYFSPFVRVVEFIIGIVLYYLFMETNTKVLKKLNRYHFTIIEAAALIALLVVVLFSPHLSQHIRYGLAFSPFWCLIIYTFSFQKGLISQFLLTNIFVYLGKISFSFYMVHNLVLSYIYFLWKPPLHSAIVITMCFVITLLISMVMYHYYEEPMRIKVKKFLNRKLILAPKDTASRKDIRRQWVENKQ